MTVDTAFARLAEALADRYRVERELGAGGMATVYLARDLKHDRDVAIKVLKPELAQSIASERFLREIGITARLSHPHVMPLLDSGVADNGDVLYYVMPLVPGESLRERLLRSDMPSTADAIRLATEVTEALAYAHSNGVVHRDVKPDNVMLSGGHAIVVDFGIAKALGESRGAEAITSEGMSLGTPLYMAPEQAAGEPIDAEADVYAVGVILFEMLAGAPPFTVGWQQVLMEKMAKDAPSLATRAPSASPKHVALVARCLARDPKQRPATRRMGPRDGDSHDPATDRGGPARARTNEASGAARCHHADASTNELSPPCGGRVEKEFEARQATYPEHPDKTCAPPGGLILAIKYTYATPGSGKEARVHSSSCDEACRQAPSMRRSMSQTASLPRADLPEVAD